MSGLRIGFLMDPIDGLLVGHDTTFAFMFECQRRGHEIHYFEQKDLGFRGDRAAARMRTVRVRRVKGSHYEILAEKVTPLSSLDVLFLRKDPPVDIAYLHATHFADLAGSEARTFIVNDPAGLRDANEKLYALRYPDLMPLTLVSNDLAAIRAFLDEVGGEMVVKPIDGFGGRGVLHVRRDDRNTSSLLELVTDHGCQAIVAQQYLPESREGDKRIIVLDGEPLGAMLRVPNEDDVRANLAAGGRFTKAALSARDREICGRLAPDLRRRGLYFVGLDVIGSYLTEVNVTSPTGIEEINALDGIAIERNVMDFVEAKASERVDGQGGLR